MNTAAAYTEPITVTPRVDTVTRRSVPRVPTAATAAALLGALVTDGDPLESVLRTIGRAANTPNVIFWRRDSRDRLMLTRRVGDAAPGVTTPRMVALSNPDEGSAVAPGLPLELHAAPAVVQVIRLLGQPFAGLAVADGIVAVGPLRTETLRRTSRERLTRLAGLAEAAVREALRVATLDATIESLRREGELGRRAIGSTIDEQRSMELLCELAITTSASSGGFVAVRHRERFHLAVTRNLPDRFALLDLTPGGGVLEEVPGLPGLLVVAAPERLAALGVGGLLAVSGPAHTDQQSIIFGLVPDDAGALAVDCATLLETLVTQAALVLEAATAARDTADRHTAALRGLCQALDVRSAATADHHHRVAETAAEIADRLAVDPATRQLVVDAALVHDAGLLAATADGAVAAEFAHPSVGADMAALVPGAAALAPLIRAHHEWWDGFGFPNGLAGDAIPLGARILATAEFTVECHQSDPPLPAATLISELRARRGTQLDPALADIMLAIVTEDQ
jgi:hypothetical protein